MTLYTMCKLPPRHLELVLFKPQLGGGEHDFVHYLQIATQKPRVGAFQTSTRYIYIYMAWQHLYYLLARQLKRKQDKGPLVKGFFSCDPSLGFLSLWLRLGSSLFVLLFPPLCRVTLFTKFCQGFHGFFQGTQGNIAKLHKELNKERPARNSVEKTEVKIHPGWVRVQGLGFQGLRPKDVLYRVQGLGYRVSRVET